MIKRGVIMSQPDKKVHLSLDASGMPVPDHDPVQVKKGNQKVKWCADFPFKIDIAEYGDVSYGAGDDDGPHNCKTGYFARERRYKYSITANGKTNDPGLDVIP
jgi:hypothetical protein